MDFVSSKRKESIYVILCKATIFLINLTNGVANLRLNCAQQCIEVAHI